MDLPEFPEWVGYPLSPELLEVCPLQEESRAALPEESLVACPLLAVSPAACLLPEVLLLGLNGS